MSGRIWKSIISDAKDAGYEVTLCYVAVRNPETSISRIQNRVKEGGHNIPGEVVRRGYYRSISSFFNLYQKLSDNWYFFDNSKDSAELIALRENSTKHTIFNKKEYEGYEQLRRR